MTEKQYGGATSHGFKSNSVKANTPPVIQVSSKSNQLLDEGEEKSDSLSPENIEKFKKAGKISTETIKFAKTFIKKGTPLLEIAEKIENKIMLKALFLFQRIPEPLNGAFHGLH